MSTPSPGPGWWQASDGKWYPQQWEYRRIGTGTFDDPHEATGAAVDVALPLGREGWEMVTCTLTPYDRSAVDYGAKGGGNIYNLNLRGGNWFASILLKRPIAPSQP
jgi:hypothetical protein